MGPAECVLMGGSGFSRVGLSRRILHSKCTLKVDHTGRVGVSSRGPAVTADRDSESPGGEELLLYEE